jgi:actin related protein 2/3 complex subunit 1A/1B
MSNIAFGDTAVHVASFGPGGKQLAFSPNNHRIYIANVAAGDCTKWAVPQALPAQHVQPVSGIDWHHETNRIVSCSHDRTVFVWTYDAATDAWVPAAALMEQITRGCTGCAWTADGKAFLVASALETVAVSSWDKNNNIWGSRFFSAHPGSSVTAIAAHPYAPVAATASTSGSVRLFCVKRSKPAAGQKAFGDMLGELAVGSFVHSLSWSPDGAALCVASHDSSVTVWSGPAADPEDPNTPEFAAWTAQRVTLPSLPFTAIAFISPTAIVAGGYDFLPVLLERKGAAWGVTREGRQIKVQKEMTEQEKARAKFTNMALMGQAEAVELPQTRHTNTITVVLPVPAGACGGAEFATASLDGRVELWKTAEMSAKQ